MIVVDNSVLVSINYDGGVVGEAAAKRLLGAGDWYVPALIDVEFVSATRGLLRGGKITKELAEEAVRELPLLPMHRVPHEGLLPRMWELRDNFSAYDAAYVALAEQLDATLLTSDVRMYRGTGKRCAVELIG
ncbi:type II toxin-antitoxin system VapC family toxin [Streptomyces sp. NPDC047046]|uniref:type II toxin-antitoxin system VapC family toxin n=1 Tax=Streptomyces sp. NPDC047046 TaxID=3155378 RepID=UPI0033C230E8